MSNTEPTTVEERVAALEGRVTHVEAVIEAAGLPDPTPDPDPEPEPEPTPVPTEEELRWIAGVTKVMSDYGLDEASANAALIAVLTDHEQRGALWTSAVNTIMANYGSTEDEANASLLRLLQSLEG